MSRRQKRQLRLAGGGALWAAGMLVSLSAVVHGAMEWLQHVHVG
jgi:hypothetical protein